MSFKKTAKFKKTIILMPLVHKKHLDTIKIFFKRYTNTCVSFAYSKITPLTILNRDEIIYFYNQNAKLNQYAVPESDLDVGPV